MIGDSVRMQVESQRLMIGGSWTFRIAKPAPKK